MDDTRASDDKLGASADVSSRPAHLITVRGSMLWIGTLLTLVVLYLGSPVLIPIAMALLLAIAFSGVIEWLEKWRIPPACGSAIIVLLLVGVSFASVYGLITPLQHWISRAPQGMQRVEQHLGWLQQPIHEIKQLQQTVEQVFHKKSANVDLTLQGISLTRHLFGWTTTFIYGLSITIALLYFFLATGRNLMRGIIHALPRIDEKEQAVELAFQVQKLISRYLFIITIINFALGVIVALFLWVVGMPDPVLWGAMVAVCNYIPYLGTIASSAIISVVAVISIPDFSVALFAISVVVLLTTAEGQYVTPQILGRRMALNPVMVFIALIIGAWMWGVVGAFISVPALACATLACEEIESLKPVAGFLRS